MPQLIDRVLKGLLLACLSFFLVAGCSGNFHKNIVTSHSPREISACRIIKHVMGETCIPANPQRVVVLWIPTLANLLALGIKPIGITSYPAASGIQIPIYLQDKVAGVEWVGDQNQPNLEKILRLQPDLILGIIINRKIYPQLSQIAPTVLFDWEGTSFWQKNFIDVANALGKTETADRLLKDYSQRLKKLEMALSDRNKQQKISFVHLCCDEIAVDAKNSFIGSILEAAELQRPPAQDIVIPSGRIKLSSEELEKADGDILFVATFAENDRQIWNRLKQKPVWKKLRGIQQNRVYLVDYSVWRGGDILAANVVIDQLFKYLVLAEKQTLLPSISCVHSALFGAVNLFLQLAVI
jgi:iron complex transport system substrate-binding protein